MIRILWTCWWIMRRGRMGGRRRATCLHLHTLEANILDLPEL